MRVMAAAILAIGLTTCGGNNLSTSEDAAPLESNAASTVVTTTSTTQVTTTTTPTTTAVGAVGASSNPVPTGQRLKLDNGQQSLTLKVSALRIVTDEVTQLDLPSGADQFVAIPIVVSGQGFEGSIYIDGTIGWTLFADGVSRGAPLRCRLSDSARYVEITSGGEGSGTLCFAVANEDLEGRMILEAGLGNSEFYFETDWS